MLGCIEKIEHEENMIWPAARSGHRICTSENFAYLFGGYDPIKNNILYNELWRFNITTEKWDKLPNKEGLCPNECASSSMVLWMNKIIIFGGSGYPFGHNNSSKLLMYCLQEYKWFDLNESARKNLVKNLSEVEIYSDCGCKFIKGEYPIAKYGQSVILTKSHKLIIFSGTTGRWFTDELHIFDLIKHEWEKIELCKIHNEQAPTGRYRHEAIVWNDLYMVFGGSILYEIFGFEDIPVFDIKMKQWKKIHTQSNLPIDKTNVHNYPKARKAHSCVLYKDSVYMIGGRNDTTAFSDCWVLDLKKMCWLNTSKLIFPYEIYFHSADVTATGCMYIFGGVQSDHSRTTDLHYIWLKVPSLLQQSWLKVSGLLKENNMLTKQVVIKLGLPRVFLDRLLDNTLVRTA